MSQRFNHVTKIILYETKDQIHTSICFFLKYKNNNNKLGSRSLVGLFNVIIVVRHFKKKIYIYFWSIEMSYYIKEEKRSELIFFLLKIGWKKGKPRRQSICRRKVNNKQSRLLWEIRQSAWVWHGIFISWSNSQCLLYRKFDSAMCGFTSNLSETQIELNHFVISNQCYWFFQSPACNQFRLTAVFDYISNRIRIEMSYEFWSICDFGHPKNRRAFREMNLIFHFSSSLYFANHKYHRYYVNKPKTLNSGQSWKLIAMTLNWIVQRANSFCFQVYFLLTDLFIFSSSSLNWFFLLLFQI